jgi:hypothetical protein
MLTGPSSYPRLWSPDPVLPGTRCCRRRLSPDWGRVGLERCSIFLYIISVAFALHRVYFTSRVPPLPTSPKIHTFLAPSHAVIRAVSRDSRSPSDREPRASLGAFSCSLTSLSPRKVTFDSIRMARCHIGDLYRLSRGYCPSLLVEPRFPLPVRSLLCLLGTLIQFIPLPQPQTSVCPMLHYTRPLRDSWLPAGPKTGNESSPPR